MRKITVGVSIVGVGPGDSELLTIKAVRLIKEADVIITPVKKDGDTNSTALKIASPYIDDKTKVKYYYFPMVHNFSEDKNIQNLFKEHGESINRLTATGKKVVLITLGDPGVYSTFSYIAPYLKDIDYVPGIPSFIHGAALAKIPLCLGEESFCVINMSDKEENIRGAFKLHKNIVVMKVCIKQDLLKELILTHNKKPIFMSNIGFENETISEDISILDKKMPYFTVGIIK